MFAFFRNAQRASVVIVVDEEVAAHGRFANMELMIFKIEEENKGHVHEYITLHRVNARLNSFDSHQLIGVHGIKSVYNERKQKSREQQFRSKQKKIEDA